MLFWVVVLFIIWIANQDSDNGYKNNTLNTQKPAIEEIVPPENRLTNWEEIFKNDYYFKNVFWHHKLTVDNSQWWSDAIVKLVPVGKKSIYTAYIRDGYSIAVDEIPDGQYEIYFVYVKWYNYGAGKPLWVSGAQKADKIYTFNTTNEGNYQVSKELTISLYKTVNWNLNTDFVSDDAFNSL